MKTKTFRLLGQVSAIALLGAAVASPAQATWFTDLWKIKNQPPKTQTPAPSPAPTPKPTPAPTPTPTPPAPPPPPPSSTGGAVDVPEPGMIGLFGLGVAGLVASRRRRANKRPA